MVSSSPLPQGMPAEESLSGWDAPEHRKALKALGLDIGTTSVKVALLDTGDGAIEFSTTDIADLNERPAPDYAERDLVKVWERATRAIRSLKNPGSVEAISVDATSGTVVAVGSDGEPLFPALLYGDKRAKNEVDEILRLSASAREYQTLLPVDASLVLPKILWLRKNMSGFERVRAVLHESDFIVGKLCGAVATSPNVAGKAHVDVRTKSYLEEVYEDLDVPISLLPPIKEVGDVIGYVSECASLETGLPRGIPVVNGVTDATAGDIATGVLDTGQLNATIGATLVVHAVVDKPVPDTKGRIYYKTYLGSTYIAGGATDAGTLPLDAVSKLLRLNMEELNAEAAGVPAGCDGLLAQPQWTGTRVPSHNPNVRGFFTGLTANNCTPGHIFRSLLEGNSAVLVDIVHIVEEVTGIAVKEVRTCGGGSRSDLQNQIIADMTGLDVLAVERSEAAVGSALLAAWGGDRGEDIGQLAARVIRPRLKYAPKGDLAEVYTRHRELLWSQTDKLYGVRR